jgi:hypothetical protein
MIQERWNLRRRTWLNEQLVTPLAAVTLNGENTCGRGLPNSAS